MASQIIIQQPLEGVTIRASHHVKVFPGPPVWTSGYVVCTSLLCDQGYAEKVAESRAAEDSVPNVCAQGVHSNTTFTKGKEHRPSSLNGTSGYVVCTNLLCDQGYAEKVAESTAAEDSVPNVCAQGVHSNTTFTKGKEHRPSSLNGLILASGMGAWTYNCHKFVHGSC